MLKLRLFITLILFSISFFGFSQKKSLSTKFTTEKITIDGKFDEDSWKTADIATDFLMIAPDNGKPESKEHKTEVKIVYDNNAIYIAAKLYDNEPDKIRKELSTRDNFVTADHFGVFLNGYNDGQQEFRFFVSASGVQQDVLYTESNGEDSSWNAIWDSHVEITNDGWNVEMRIPYAALRFSSEKKQIWGLNFYREFTRERQQYTWNLIDNKIGSESNQAGILEGIENIDTPTRLFFIPYSSFYLNSNDNTKTKGELKGGLDIKYGINDAFTLDAILVPDFGQTAFDNVVLNLGPFEQQFNENRPFFTEGTELFSKGNLVYSRRIGGNPTGSPEVGPNEEVVESPSNVNLLNALKISGRTKQGLGIGVLNAVTSKTYAKIQNTITGAKRSEIIEPLANYNVLVFDQRFRKNSSVSFVNTNVTRDGSYRDADVAAMVFDLNTKANTFNLSGDFKYSIVNEVPGIDDRKGYNTTLNFAETSGKVRVFVGGQYVSNDFDNNDLGINYQTHYHSISSNVSYRILKPTKRFNSFFSNLYSYAEFDNRTGRIQGYNHNLNFNTTNKKNDYYGIGFNGSPFDIYDFYEPRSEGEIKFVKIPRRIGSWLYISTNYNRKLALDFNADFTFMNEKHRNSLYVMFNPRYRFSNKFSLIYSFEYGHSNNTTGWVETEGSDIIFARRDRDTYTFSLTGKYTLNNVMNFNFSGRYYWSFVENHNFLTLQDDGGFIPNTTFTGNRDSSFNSWNYDLSYSWWFAPGSQISVLYRNSATIFERDFSKSIITNINNLLDNNHLDHVFSVSIRYFIDYNSAKHWFSKK